MQAGDLNACVRCGTAQLVAFRSPDQMGIFGQRERSHFKAFVAGLLRKGALRRKLQIANDFIA